MKLPIIFIRRKRLEDIENSIIALMQDLLELGEAQGESTNTVTKLSKRTDKLHYRLADTSKRLDRAINRKRYY